MSRVMAYVDGFNLYFGLRDKKWQKYLWLDLPKLCSKLLISGQELTVTKYFTARITGNFNTTKVELQNAYLEALTTLDDLQIIYGRYQMNPRKCQYCQRVDKVPIEKMTDVNIAVEMLSDAYQDLFDTAILISADNDLAPVVTAIKALFADKHVVVVFPPLRHSTQLKMAADDVIPIYRKNFERSLLPDIVVKADGFPLTCPAKWK